MEYHEPVLLKEAVDALNIKTDGIYIDATYGGGGHSKEILSRLEGGQLIVFDQDADAAFNKIKDERIKMVSDNFSNMKSRLAEMGIDTVDGILADLGISSHQIDVPERGFSTRFDSLLDMRMDQRNSFTARDIINEYSEKELVRIFSSYGEIRNSKQLAAAICKERLHKPINTTFELKAAIASCIPFNKEHQYMAQLFQALRIEVNAELEALRALLMQSAQILAQGGRLVVIAYHSLEDRLVKNIINTGSIEGIEEKDIYGNVLGKKFNPVNRKAIVPTEAEIKRNPRSRSAKLRIGEKI